MPFNGSGTFVRVHDWSADRDAGLKINADRMDAEDDGFATGLSNCLTKDGQTTATGDLPMGTNKITGLGDPTAAQDAATKTYVDTTSSNNVGDTDGSLASGGSSNAYTLTSNAQPGALATGQFFVFRANHDSTGAATLNRDSQGAKKWFWSDGTTQMASGDIVQDCVFAVEYDATLDASSGGYKTIFRRNHPSTTQRFTSSGTWTRPTGCTHVDVYVTGAGGGGGAADGQGANTYAYAGGGQGGSTAIKYRLDVRSISSSTITVGTGGAGGTTPSNNGTDGGNSVWSDGSNTYTGGGGEGGTGKVATGSVISFGEGGGSGTATGGDINIHGSPGIGAYGQTHGGGAGYWGGGTKGDPIAASTATPGVDATSMGSGGSGANTYTSATADAAGGDGADGQVLVIEYYSGV